MITGANRGACLSGCGLKCRTAPACRAQEGAQETAVTLLGLLIGTAIAPYVADSSLASWPASSNYRVVPIRVPLPHAPRPSGGPPTEARHKYEV